MVGAVVSWVPDAEREQVVAAWRSAASDERLAIARALAERPDVDPDVPYALIACEVLERVERRRESGATTDEFAAADRALEHHAMTEGFGRSRPWIEPVDRLFDDWFRAHCAAVVAAFCEIEEWAMADDYEQRSAIFETRVVCGRAVFFGSTP